MRQSQLFTKIERAAPKDEVSVNAQLLARGGFVYKNSAGVYSYLPLGWRVIQKIAAIIREEMDAIGGQEMLMPSMIEKRYLEATDRWKLDVGYKTLEEETRSSHFAIGWSHEEVATEIAARYVSSYKDLPMALYQIQTKIRNEPRAKSGLLRCREFIMKDLYSFHASEEDFREYYEKAAQAYLKIFSRCGLEALNTLAAGGVFTSNHTNEFQVIASVGEDTIFVCSKCKYAENNEISKLKNGDACPKCGGTVKEEKSIEVGNIFPLGTKYAEAFDLKFKDEKGKENLVVMGSYGIGLGRVMATVVELFNDEKGIIWPAAIAPFEAHLLELEEGLGKSLYDDLQKRGVSVLYDDRNVSAGEKLAEADVLGIPWRLIVSKKTGEKIEIKKRDGDAAKLVSREELMQLLCQIPSTKHEITNKFQAPNSKTNV